MAADDEVAAAGAGWRMAFAGFATVGTLEGFFSFVARGVAVTAFFSVAFVVAAFLAAFVVLVSASLRVVPVRCREFEVAAFATDLAPPAGAADRVRATALAGVVLALRTVAAVAAARLPATLPVLLAFATGCCAFFFDAADPLGACFAPWDTRAVGGDFRVALDAPAVVAGVIWSSSPPRRPGRGCADVGRG